MRTWSLGLSSLSLASLLASGCQPLPNIDFELNLLGCEGIDLFPLPEPPSTRGLLDHATMVGTCDDDVCSEHLPLGVGATHEFTVQVDDSEVGTPEQLLSFSLTSDAPDVVSVRDAKPREHLERATDEAGNCIDARRVSVDATMEPRAAGRAELTLKRGDQVVERFVVVVAEPSTLQVSAESQLKKIPDAVLIGVQVEERDGLLNFFQRTRAEDGREVFYPDEYVTWSVEDPSVLELLPIVWAFYGEPATTVHTRAAGARVHAVGGTEVTVAVHGLEARFEVTVESVPRIDLPEEESGDEESEGAASAQD